MDDTKLTLILLGLSNLTTLGLFLAVFYNLKREEKKAKHVRRKKRC